MNCKFFTIFFLSVTMVASTKACEFSNDAIKAIYDRLENFRKTKAFDPDDPQVPINQYHYYDMNDTSYLKFEIGDDIMDEYFNINEDTHEIVTERGRFLFKDEPNVRSILHYKKNLEGRRFEDWSNGKRTTTPIRPKTGEPTNLDVEERYQKVLVSLKQMRDKMHQFPKSLSKEEFERIEYYKLTPQLEGGYHIHYVERTSESLEVTEDSEAKLTGKFTCNNMDQKFIIIDGRVILDGKTVPSSY